MEDARLGKRVLPVNIKLSDGTAVSFNIDFPLADGTVMLQGPFSYNSDGLSTTHSVAWMSEPAFVEAYRRGVARPCRVLGGIARKTSRWRLRRMRRQYRNLCRRNLQLHRF